MGIPAFSIFVYTDVSGTFHMIHNAFISLYHIALLHIIKNFQMLLICLLENAAPDCAYDTYTCQRGYSIPDWQYG